MHERRQDHRLPALFARSVASRTIVMARKESATRAHILQVAAELVSEKVHEGLHISDVAARAHIGVPTIYYHFDSLVHLVAEAQLVNYLSVVEPLHHHLSLAEGYLAAGEESAFWDSIEVNLIRVWSSGQLPNKMGILRLFLDVGSDPGTRATFADHVTLHFSRWTALIEGAQTAGWLSADVDAKTLTTFFWTASVGQLLAINSDQVNLSPEEIRSFVRRIIRVAHVAPPVMPTEGSDSTPRDSRVPVSTREVRSTRGA
jgi:AcrR family transcriptional regulator